MYQHHLNDSAPKADWPAPDMRWNRAPAPPRVTSAVTLFADIVGYTRHCEALDPQEAFLLLADFYRRTSETTALHNAAMVDHFGDAVLAVWKGQATLAVQAYRALRCGFAILVAMERWNEWRARDRLPEVKLGIGIHVGPVLFGRPHADDRSQPSVFGDTVNIASRLERQTRSLRTDIVISEELYRQVAQVAGNTTLLDYFPAMMSVTLSGRARPLDIRPADFHPWSMKKETA